MHRPVRARTLRRAAEILGGPAQLRTYLNVSAICLGAWLTGIDTAPTDVFLKAVDVIMEDAARQKRAP
jgi:hypothetical protein